MVFSFVGISKLPARGDGYCDRVVQHLHSLDASKNHFMGIVIGAPGIHAELICSVMLPVPAPKGTRKFTWYASVVPGYPTAERTSADSPLTVTSMGELTTAK